MATWGVEWAREVKREAVDFAGRPGYISRLMPTAFMKALQKRIDAKGGWEVIFERVAGGETIAAIAKDYEVSRNFLSTQLWGEKLRPQMLEARRMSADVHAEEALRIADEVEPDRDHVAKAKLQIEHRKWMAGAFDRATFAQTPELSVNVNIGTLHLDALRARNAKVLPSRPALPVLPAEILDDGGAIQPRRLPAGGGDRDEEETHGAETGEQAADQEHREDVPQRDAQGALS